MLLPNEENLQLWNFGTAIANFFIYLASYFVITFLSTYLETTDDETFHLKYEKYSALAIGFYFLISFALQCTLLAILRTNKNKLLKYWLITYSVLLAIHEIFILGSAIYIILEGTLYVACTLLGIFIIYAVLIGHTIALAIYTLRIQRLQPIESIQTEEEQA